MGLQVELSHPLGDVRVLVADAVHEVGQRRIDGLRAALQVLHSPGHLAHLGHRAAAAVAETVCRQPPIIHVLVLQPVPDAHQVLGVGPEVVGVVVGENLGPVDARPLEGVVREARRVVPGDLGGAEVVHAGLLQYLGKRRRVAEHIRQPQRVGGVAEPLTRGPLTHEELPDERLPRGHVAVGLDPHRPIRLPAALRRELLHALEDAGVLVLHDLGMARRGLQEDELGVLPHQVNHRRECPRALPPGLRQWPQPRRVDVRSADDADGRCRGAVLGGQQRRHELPRLGELRPPALLARLGGNRVHSLPHLGESSGDAGLAQRVPIQRIHELPEGPQVEDEGADVRTLHDHFDAVEAPRLPLHDGSCIMGLGPGERVARVCLEGQMVRSRGGRLRRHHHHRVESVEDAHRLTVDEEERLAAGLRADVYRLALQAPGQLHVAPEPGRHPATAPLRPRLREAPLQLLAGAGLGPEVFLRLTHLNRHIRYLLPAKGRVVLLEAGQLSERPPVRDHRLVSPIVRACASRGVCATRRPLPCSTGATPRRRRAIRHMQLPQVCRSKWLVSRLQ